MKKTKKKERPSPLPDGARRRRKTDYVKKLDKVFSQYIRLRDAMENGMARCISCGGVKPLEMFDNGHYHSRTHMSTRWDEDNCHAECRFCNRFKADHMIGYRENLIRKIGQQRYDLLAWKARQSKHWAEFELKELVKHYTDMVKKLTKEKGL